MSEDNQSQREPATIYVCAACRNKGFPGDFHERPGSLFAHALKERVKTKQLEEKISVKAVGCLSVCKRPTTIAITQPGKWTYFFGDLDHEAHLDDLLAYALSYRQSKDGITEWKDRPDVIKKGAVARVPALGIDHGLVKDPGEPFET